MPNCRSTELMNNAVKALHMLAAYSSKDPFDFMPDRETNSSVRYYLDGLEVACVE